MGPIARGQITLVDLSDIISQSTAPASPTEGMLWMNTGVTPPVLMVYRGGKWVQQNDFKQDPEYNVIKETLKTNTSGIDVLKNEIKLKVTQTEVTNTVVTEIGKVQGENDKKFTEINNKVSDINIGLESITTRVGSVESAQTEVNGQVTNLTERVQEAEQKVTESAITTTVSKSFYTKNDIDAKGYQTSSDVQQTVDAFQLKFTESGGYNRLYNGAFLSNDLTSWSNWGSCTRTIQDSTSGIQKEVKLVTNGVDQGIYQSVTGLAIGEKYTVSALVKAGSGKASLQLNHNNSYPSTYTKATGKYETLSLTFTATATTARIELGQNGGAVAGTYYFTGVILVDGELSLPFSPHPSEVYDGITKIDKQGVTVTASNVKSRTNMSANGFKITKTDTNEDVFKVNSDGTLALKGSMEITGGSVPGGLIVNGTIGADKIVAAGITANKIKAGSLTSTNGKSVFNLDTGAFNIGTTSDATYLRYDTTNGLDIKGKMTFSSGTVFPDSVQNDKIQIGGSNLIVGNEIGVTSSSIVDISNYTDNGTVTINKTSTTDGLYLNTGSLIGESSKIVLAFKIKKVSGTLSNIGGHTDTGLSSYKVTIDNTDYTHNWNSPATTSALNDGNFHEVKVYLNYTKQASTNPKLYVQPNRALSTAVNVEIQELRLEKGVVSTSWTLSARDYQEAIGNANSVANSANQTASNTESILNGLTQVRPDGQTVIDGDKILTGSVKADKVELYGLVVKDKSDDSVITFNIDDSGSVTMKGSVQSMNFDDTEGQAQGFKLTADGKAYLNEAIVDGEVRLPNAGLTNFGGARGNANWMVDSAYMARETGWKNVTNDTFGTRRVYVPTGAKVGDTLSISYKVEYADLVRSQSDGALYFQGAGNVTQWATGAWNGGPRLTDKITWGANNKGAFTVQYQFTLVAEHLQNQYWDVGIRANFVSSGAIRIYQMKVELGSKYTPWCAYESEVGSMVRIWAGAGYNNRENAPFKVLHNGEVIATKGRFEGITSGAFNLSDMLTIDKANGYRHFGANTNDLRNEISLTNTSFSTNFSIKNIAKEDAFAVNLEGVGSTTVGTETFLVGSLFTVSNVESKMLSLGEKGKHLLYYEKSGNTNKLNIKSNNPNSSTDFLFEKETGDVIVEVAGEVNATQAMQIDKVRMVKRTNDPANYGIDFIIL